MGINVNGLRFLLYAKSAGVDFTKTAMIGRQGLHLRFDKFCNVLRTEFNYDIDLKALEAIHREKYCDELLRYLGASVVHSYDYSNYEGSTHVHDFNQSVPEECFTQYTAIIETGTLEHVFNFPIAIKNCMQMIKVGGHYLGMSPTNNYMGHGFYQFSPDLYFRVFSQDNGFRIEHMILCEGRDTKKWFKVPDPEEVKCLVGISNSNKTSLFILAKRLADCSIFSTPPLQSFYVPTWKKAEPEIQISATKKKLSKLKHLIPKFVRKRFKKHFGQTNATPLFSPFDPSESHAKGSGLEI